MRLCCAAFLLFSVALFAKEEALTPDAYVASIAKVNLDPDAYFDYQTYHDALWRVVSGRVERVSTVKELKTVFYLCHTLYKKRPETSQDQLKWVCIYHLSLSAVMSRLSDLKTPEAVHLMVELYCDKNVRWDGGFALEGVEAILQCGKLALPCLEARRDRRNVEEIIGLIKKGVRTTL